MILVAHVICDRRFVAHTHTHLLPLPFQLWWMLRWCCPLLYDALSLLRQVVFQFLRCKHDHNSRPDKTGKLIREALWIRKSRNMNGDDGSYQLSHVWNKLLTDVRNRTGSQSRWRPQIGGWNVHKTSILLVVNKQQLVYIRLSTW